MAEEGGKNNIREIVQAVVQEFVRAEQSKAEPGYKTELLEERRRRETLEQRVNELVTETERARAKAEEAERSASIRAELQKLGVAKVELAYKAVKDEIQRGEDGRLMAQDGVDMKDYLTRFVGENPELLPARLAGGSGASAGQRSSGGQAAIDIDKIKPGMSAEELDRVRQEIARVASQTLRGM
ncbi:MAG: hypothetical protein JO307_25405 [Bryobacterales bacterium]|nr:hypothetical protein [Bryobacterales bacterium]MBV9397569.1 hypothetical protein [Bryobacterales bacterium]